MIEKMKFNKMLVFNFKLIEKSIFSIILFALSCIVQPIMFLAFSLSGNGISNYMLLITLIPLFLFFILNSFLVFKLFSETRKNSIEIICRTLPIRKIYVFLARLLLISIINLIGLFCSFLFDLIILMIFNETNLIVYIFISNIFISFFIITLYTALITLLSMYIKNNYFLISIVPITMFLTVPSLIARPFESNNEIEIKYNDDIYSWTKICNQNQQYYAVKIENNSEDTQNNINPIKYINNPSWYNYLFGSEWISTYYQSLYNSLGLNNLNVSNNAPFSYDQYYFHDISFNQFSNINPNEMYVYRAQDKNLLELSNDVGSEILFNNLSEIIESNNILKHPETIIKFQNDIKIQPNWSLLSGNYLELLRTFYGLDNKYPNLFYLFKYYQQYSIRFNNVFDLINQKYGQDVLNLIIFIYSSSEAKLNLLNGSNNILLTNHSLDYFYPDDCIYNDAYPITSTDKEILSNCLIRFINDNPYILINDQSNQYNYKSFEISILQQIDTSIINEQTYKEYIDKISLRLDNTKTFLSKLKKCFTNLNIYEPKLSENYVSLNEYNYIYTIDASNYLRYSAIIMTLYFLMSSLLAYLSAFVYTKRNL